MATSKDARSDDSVTQRDDAKALAWQDLCKSSQGMWNRSFPHVKGQRCIFEDFNDSSQEEPVIFAAEIIALEVVLRARLIQQLVYKSQRAKCEAELCSFLWLLFSCIQMCDVSREKDSQPANVSPEKKLQPAKFSLELGDKPEPARTASNASPLRNSHKSVSPESKSPGNSDSSSRSGRNMSVPGDGISEQEQLQLGGKILKPDMTILCREGGRKYMYAVVEVKDGLVFTLPHIRQSFCQGIVATVANGLKGFQHTTRSLLINFAWMVILEYTLDADFIKKMKDLGKEVDDILPAEVKGSAKIVFAGPYDFRLENVSARRALVGLLAPSLRHEGHLEDMRRHLQVLRNDSIATTLGVTCGSVKDMELWKRSEINKLSECDPGTVSNACLIGSATETASLKRKQDDGLASDSSPNKKPKTATSSEMDAVIKAAEEDVRRLKEVHEEARLRHDKELIEVLANVEVLKQQSRAPMLV